MQQDENKQNQNEEPIDMSKVSESFKAYIEARDALFAKYGKTVSSLKKAA